MGETPEVVKIACPGCETQFRLKPKKGRLPDGPVPCPKCGESIPIVEENIRRDGSKTSPSAPQAHVFTKAGGDDTAKIPNPTTGGSPEDTPHRSDAVTSDGDEFDHIAVSPGLSNSNPKSTFLGMGSALGIEGPGPRHDKTAVVDGDLLAKIRSESSVVEDEDEDGRENEAQSDDPLRETSEQHDVFKRETSENKAIGPDDLAESQKVTSHEDETKEIEAPGQMVLGKIKIKKKLKRAPKKTLKTKPSGQKPGARAPSKPSVSDEATPAKSSSNKPSLSSLLKKARQKKDKLNIPAPKSGARDAASADASSEKLDRALDGLANETARSLADKSDKSDKDRASEDNPPAFDSGDSSMIDMLRRRVAENQQPGAASERRGSGYIRLPTAEIQDVLGHGTYRLRVEDIVYEPIDKEGLTQLVKRGVLLGAEEIAEPDGDWMPIADHPVFLELRRKMAREAHDLLKKYKPKDDTPAKVSDADLPGRVDELPAPSTPPTGDVDEFDVDDIPEIEAELEEEAEKAANELFGDVDEDVDEEAKHTPPPTPAAPPEADTDDAEDDASIKFDYDALGVEESDVEVEETTHEPADETGSLSSRGGSMRTWIPLIAATAVLVALAGLALSPVGRPYLDGVPFLEGIFGEQTVEDNAGDEQEKVVAANEEKEANAEVRAAVEAASSNVTGALDIDASDAELQESVADDLAKASDFAGAARLMGVLWQERSDDADFAANYVDILKRAGQFAAARRVALDGLQLNSDAHDFASMYTEAIKNDPALGALDVVDVTAEMADAASVKPDGKRTVYHLTRDGERAFEFKPAQADWERGWRTSVAAYRLCQIMVCNFDVPRTRPARIDKATFEALAKAGDAKPAADLAWVTQDGKKYVYGALQDAFDDEGRFPIEDTNLWRGWLSTGGDQDMAKVSATKALAGLKGQTGGFYEPLAERLGETTLQQLAAQLS